MSTTTITVTIIIDGEAREGLTVLLSDATSTYGVKRNDTDAVVVADGTAMTDAGSGLYTYTFTDPAADLTYTAAVEYVYDGETYRQTGTIAGGRTPATADDAEDDGPDLVAAATEPASVTIDGTTTTQQPLRDRLAVDQYTRATRALSNRGAGMVIQKIIPHGSVC